MKDNITRNELIMFIETRISILLARMNESKDLGTDGIPTPENSIAFREWVILRKASKKLEGIR